MTDMGIIKLEINMAELSNAMESFTRNRLQAFETLSQDVKSSISTTINQLLNMEISAFLGQPDQSDNKRNGYKEREYAIKGLGCIRIRVPRDRKGQYSSQIIPKNERIDPRLKEDLAVLHLAGISTRTLGMISRRILGIEVSRQTITQSLGLIEESALKWLERPLTDEYWALFIDGTNFRIQRRGTTEREPALVVLGLDRNNRLNVLAIEPGQKDNVNCWREVFSDLKRRGLHSEAVQLGIMDGLPGIEQAFTEEFTQAKAARCWVHAMRNAMAKVPNRFSATFKSLADNVGYASDERHARLAFHTLKETLGVDAKRAVACLEKDLEALLVHYSFDKRLWLTLRSTNPIERVNKEFKRRTKTMESLGERTLRIVTAFTALRLHFNWHKIPADSPTMQNLLPVRKRANQIDLTMNTLLH